MYSLVSFLETALLKCNSYTIQFTHLNCKIWWVLVYIQLCNYHHNLILEHFITLKRISVPISNYSPSPLPQPKATTNTVSVFIGLPVLDISYKRNIICVFCGWVLLLSLLLTRFIHVVVCISIPFFLLTKNTSFGGYITFCLSIHQLIDIWVVSTFWLLKIILPWTFKYKWFFGHMFSFLLGKYLE